MLTSGQCIRFFAGSLGTVVGGRGFLNCVWELTYRCNARCFMCDYWQRPSEPQRELSTADIKTGLAKIAEHGCRLINFSGGEPTLRMDLEDVVAFACERGMWTSVVTNGSHLTRARLARLRDAGPDSLFISLDSLDPKRHDTNRGFPGLHGRVLECLDWLADDFAVGHRIAGLMVIIGDENLSEIAGLVETAASRGLWALVQPRHARKTGAGNHITAVSVSLVRSLLFSKERTGSVLNSRGYLRALLDQGKDCTGSRCRAGEKYFSIGPYGYLHPCVDMPAAGHVLKDEISVVCSASARAGVHACSGCRYCFKGEADATLSLGGCLEKAQLALQIIRQDAKKRRSRKRARHWQRAV